MGPESQIRYTMVNVPKVTKDYISLDINVSVALSAQGPWACCFWGLWTKGAGVLEGGELEWHPRRGQGTQAKV